MMKIKYNRNIVLTNNVLKINNYNIMLMNKDINVLIHVQNHIFIINNKNVFRLVIKNNIHMILLD